MDLTKLTQAQLVSMLTDMQTAQAAAERMAGIEIGLAEGTSAKGIAYKVLAVKGGALGWRGLNLKPASWAALLAVREEVSAAMAFHFPEGK